MTYVLYDKGNNIYKIGTSEVSAEERLKKYCKHPGISILFKTEKNIEKLLHREFGHKRVGDSEWFHLDDNDLFLIKKYFGTCEERMSAEEKIQVLKEELDSTKQSLSLLLLLLLDSCPTIESQLRSIDSRINVDYKDKYDDGDYQDELSLAHKYNLKPKWIRELDKHMGVVEFPNGPYRKKVGDEIVYNKLNIDYWFGKDREDPIFVKTD